MAQARSFTDGPPHRVLRQMALPMVWGLLATMSFNAIDTYFVALLGSEPLAAMSFTMPVVMAVTNMGIGLGTGLVSVLARSYGAGRDDAARHLATDGLLLVLLISVVLGAIGLTIMDEVFALLGAGEALMPLIADYMVVWFLSTPLVLMTIALMSVLRATGQSRIAGNLMLLMALVNVILDPILIFGWGPIPAIGIAGAAWASAASRLILLVLMVYYCGPRLGLMASPTAKLRQLRSSWAPILRVGLPSMATIGLPPVAGAIIIALVASYGSDAVAGLGIALRIEPMVLITFYALSSVFGPFLAQNMRSPQRMLEGLRVARNYCLIAGVLIALLLYVLGAAIASLFSDSAHVIAVAALHLSIVPLSYGFHGVVMSVNAGFNGIGRPLPALTNALLRMVIIYLPLAIIGRHFFGLAGLFTAMAISNVAVGVLAYYWLRRYIRKLIAMADQAASSQS